MRRAPLRDFGIESVEGAAETDNEYDQPAGKAKPEMDIIEKFSCFLPGRPFCLYFAHLLLHKGGRLQRAPVKIMLSVLLGSEFV